MKYRIEVLEEHARELEEEQPQEPDDSEGYSSGNRGGDTYSDNDINSLFSTLK